MYRLFTDWPFGLSATTALGYVPEGYELVEKPEYKKQRLEEEIKSLEKQVEWHSGQGAAASDKLKELKKDLEKCK